MTPEAMFGIVGTLLGLGIIGIIAFYLWNSLGK
jgi:hypothetical protein